MRRILLLGAFTLFASIASRAEQPPDLTGANKETLDAYLGKVVSLRGTLGFGRDGEHLAGATKEVDFYIITGIDPGEFPWPDSWLGLHYRQVRVTGILRFRTFPRPPGGKYEGGWPQPPPDYYYMVLEQTQIQPVETK